MTTLTGKQVKIKEGTDVFQVMDSLDSDQIVEELQNRVVDTWVYSFESKGENKTGLTKAGVDECTMGMQNQGWIFDELDVDYKWHEHKKGEAIFTARVQCRRYLPSGELKDYGIRIGTKTQNSFEAFWFEKGTQKALRNAKERFIPAEIKAAIILLAKERGKITNIKEEKVTKKEPVKTTPASKPTGIQTNIANEKAGADSIEKRNLLTSYLAKKGIEGEEKQVAFCQTAVSAELNIDPKDIEVYIKSLDDVVSVEEYLDAVREYCKKNDIK